MNNSPLYYSAIKSNTIMPFAATWMELEIILSEISQAEKDKYYMIRHMWNLKKWYGWIYLQNRNRFIDVADKLTKGKQVGDKLEVWD